MLEEEGGMMRKAFILIIIVCLVFVADYFAQQRTDKKEKITAEKTVEIEKEKSEQTEQPVKLQKTEENKQTSKSQEQNLKLKKKPLDFSSLNQKNSSIQNDTPSQQFKLQKIKKHIHKPYSQQNIQQQIHYPQPIQYHYNILPLYIYRGIWIRYYFVHDNGFFFFDGYPHYVHNNYIHRYSSVDAGSFDLVDSITDKVYATFYGVSLKQSYDRAADLRDRLNNEEGFYRYFCSERFIYDPDYHYNWDPEDYPDWYWY